MSGPASCGQQVCTGRRARSTSLPSEHDLLARRARAHLRRHVEHLLQSGNLSHRSRSPLRRLGLLEEREQLARSSRSAARVVDAHRQRHAPRRAEQVAEHRDRVSRRAARTAAPGRLRAARGRRSRSSRAAARLGDDALQLARAPRAAPGNRAGRRSSSPPTSSASISRSLRPPRKNRAARGSRPRTGVYALRARQVEHAAWCCRSSPNAPSATPPSSDEAPTNGSALASAQGTRRLPVTRA